jgi:hypothetical protein
MTILSIVRFTAACGLAAIGMANVPVALVAQTPRPSAPDTIVVIGCVTQQPAGERERGAERARPLLVITDTRSKPPRKFILQGAMPDLAWHVGHTLEIHARAVSADSKDAAARDAQLPVLDVQSVVYLQPTCAAPPH